MQALKQYRFARYFFVARIVIIIGVVLLCFSGRYVAARQGHWVWQKNKSQQADQGEQVDSRELGQETRIEEKKEVSSARPARIEQEQKPVADSAAKVKRRRQRRISANKVVEKSEISSIEQQESPVAAAENNSENYNAAPSAGLNEADSYWNWLLNPRPWWELAGQKSVFRQ